MLLWLIPCRFADTGIEPTAFSPDQKPLGLVPEHGPFGEKRSADASGCCADDIRATVSAMHAFI